MSDQSFEVPLEIFEKPVVDTAMWNDIRVLVGNVEKLEEPTDAIQIPRSRADLSVEHSSQISADGPRQDCCWPISVKRRWESAFTEEKTGTVIRDRW